MTRAMPEHLWVFRGRCERVVDGDTLDCIVDEGFHGFRVERLRLLYVNTPERKGKTYLAGVAATEYVKLWVANPSGIKWPLVVQTEESDAFGRYLATVWDAESGRCLNDDLLASGHAVPYTGGRGA